jgi:hypothetical protein
MQGKSAKEKGAWVHPEETRDKAPECPTVESHKVHLIHPTELQPHTESYQASYLKVQCAKILLEINHIDTLYLACTKF